MQLARLVLVVANADDDVAGIFVKRYARQGARLLQPRDLSQSGWRYELREGAEPSIQTVVAGRVCPETRLAGVLTRIASVKPSDLPHIAPSEQVYVAHEIQAFLLSWLHTIRCPVLNRPTPTCLAGEWFSSQTWIQRAYRLGIPVARHEWCVGRNMRMKATQPVTEESSIASLTVVGSQIIGNAAPRVMQYARRLAQSAELDLLTFIFSSSANDARFLGVSLWPNLADRTIAAAVMRHVKQECPVIRSKTALA